MNDKEIKIWYISEDFRSYDRNEDDNPFKDDNIFVLSVLNLYGAVICDIDTLHSLLGISGNEDTDELGYAWLSSTFNGVDKVIFNNDKQLCNEKDVKEWYICDSYSKFDITGLKAIFIGTRTNFLDIILSLECNKGRDWTFVAKDAYPFNKLIIDGITVKI